MVNKKSIALIVGTRPNVVKAAPLYHAMAKMTDLDVRIIHTGQHHDRALFHDVLEDLSLTRPHLQISLESDTSIGRLGEMMRGLERIFIQAPPDLVVVFGDVDSSLAGALVARKMNLRLAHIEAGLRSFDQTMPEEINRRMIDHLSDYLFTTEGSARHNLLREGIEENKIHFVGNLMIEAMLNNKASKSRESGEYAVWTAHRPSNVDDAAGLQNILDGLNTALEYLDVIWPLHPRTKKNLKAFDMYDKLLEMSGRYTLRVVAPMGYEAFNGLLRSARVVITDSGGIQEEACHLGVPCLTIRENTERPVTIAVGANQLTPLHDSSGFEKALNKVLLSQNEWDSPELWDEFVSERIIEVLSKALSMKPTADNSGRDNGDA